MRSRAVGLGIMAGLAALSGCSLSERNCERQGSACTTPDGGLVNQLNLVVVTKRLSSAGGTLEMQANAFQPGANVVVTLTQNGNVVQVPLQSTDITSGTIQTMVSASTLTMLKGGPVQVTVAVAGQMGTGDLVIYVTPVLAAESVLSYAAMSSNNTPLRLGVTQRGPVLVWEKLTTTLGVEERVVREYSADPRSGVLASSMTIPWLQDANVGFNFTPSAQFAMGRSDLVVFFQQTAGTDFSVQRCQLVQASPPPCSAITDSGLMSVTAAAMDPSGVLIVASGAAGLHGYTGMTDTPVGVSGSPAQTPALLATGDLNGDMLPDVIAVDSSGGATVLLGQSNGGLMQDTGATLAAVSTVLTQAGALSSVAIGDVDGDGLPDLVLSITASPKDVRVAYNQGDGTFANAMTVATSGSVVSAIAVGNVGNGYNDIVIAASNERRLGLFLNNP